MKIYNCDVNVNLEHFFVLSPDYLNGSPSHKTTCTTDSDTGGDMSQTGGGGGGGGGSNSGGGGGISGEGSLWLCEMNLHKTMSLVGNTGQYEL